VSPSAIQLPLPCHQGTRIEDASDWLALTVLASYSVAPILLLIVPLSPSFIFNNKTIIDQTSSYLKYSKDTQPSNH
jgi:hypothetical protein